MGTLIRWHGFVDEHTILYNYTEDKGDVHYMRLQRLKAGWRNQRWKVNFRRCHFLSLVLSIIRRGSIAHYVR